MAGAATQTSLFVPRARPQTRLFRMRAALMFRATERETRRGHPMALSEKIKNHINNAWVDGYPCMLATTGKDGPNISPKGSMLVFDDQHLAYWERSKKKALE